MDYQQETRLFESALKSSDSESVDRILTEMGVWKGGAQQQKALAELNKYMHQDGLLLPGLNIDGVDEKNHLLHESAVGQVGQLAKQFGAEHGFWMDHFGTTRAESMYNKPQGIQELASDLAKSMADRKNPQARSNFEFDLYQLEKKMSKMDAQDRRTALLTLNELLHGTGCEQLGVAVGFDSKTHTLLFANPATHALTLMGPRFFSNDELSSFKIPEIGSSGNSHTGEDGYHQPKTDGQGGGRRRGPRVPPPDDPKDPVDITNISDEAREELIEEVERRAALSRQLTADAQAAANTQKLCIAGMVVGVVAAPFAAAEIAAMGGGALTYSRAALQLATRLSPAY